MSVHVMGMCFRVVFGNPNLKAVAVALADHAHDDGTNIWPSVAKLAVKTELSERTVQYKLRQLEALGLIVLVDEGGQGPKDTREYKFDMRMLRDLSDNLLKIESDKGAGDAPLTLVRVQEVQLRVQELQEKGAAVAPEPSLNHQEPSSAQARAKVSNIDFGKKRRLVLAEDPSWQSWLAVARDFFGHTGSEQFVLEGAMVVFDDIPSEYATKPKLAPERGSAKWNDLIAARKLTPLSQRMMGEAAK